MLKCYKAIIYTGAEESPPRHLYFGLVWLALLQPGSFSNFLFGVMAPAVALIV